MEIISDSDESDNSPHSSQVFLKVLEERRVTCSPELPILFSPLKFIHQNDNSETPNPEKIDSTNYKIEHKDPEMKETSCNEQKNSPGNADLNKTTSVRNIYATEKNDEMFSSTKDLSQEMTNLIDKNIINDVIKNLNESIPIDKNLDDKGAATSQEKTNDNTSFMSKNYALFDDQNYNFSHLNDKTGNKLTMQIMVNGVLCSDDKENDISSVSKCLNEAINENKAKENYNAELNEKSVIENILQEKYFNETHTANNLADQFIESTHEFFEKEQDTENCSQSLFDTSCQVLDFIGTSTKEIRPNSSQTKQNEKIKHLEINFMNDHVLNCPSDMNYLQGKNLIIKSFQQNGHLIEMKNSEKDDQLDLNFSENQTEKEYFDFQLQKVAEILDDDTSLKLESTQVTSDSDKTLSLLLEASDADQSTKNNYLDFIQENSRVKNLYKNQSLENYLCPAIHDEENSTILKKSDKNADYSQNEWSTTDNGCTSSPSLLDLPRTSHDDLGKQISSHKIGNDFDYVRDCIIGQNVEGQLICKELYANIPSTNHLTFPYQEKTHTEEKNSNDARNLESLVTELNKNKKKHFTTGTSRCQNRFQVPWKSSEDESKNNFLINLSLQRQSSPKVDSIASNSFKDQEKSKICISSETPLLETSIPKENHLMNFCNIKSKNDILKPNMFEAGVTQVTTSLLMNPTNHKQNLEIDNNCRNCSNERDDGVIKGIVSEITDDYLDKPSTDVSHELTENDEVEKYRKLSLERNKLNLIVKGENTKKRKANSNTFNNVTSDSEMSDTFIVPTKKKRKTFEITKKINKYKDSKITLNYDDFNGRKRNKVEKYSQVNEDEVSKSKNKNYLDLRKTKSARYLSSSFTSISKCKYKSLDIEKKVVSKNVKIFDSNCDYEKNKLLLDQIENKLYNIETVLHSKCLTEVEVKQTYTLLQHIKDLLEKTEIYYNNLTLAERNKKADRKSTCIYSKLNYLKCTFEKLKNEAENLRKKKYKNKSISIIEISTKQTKNKYQKMISDDTTQKAQTKISRGDDEKEIEFIQEVNSQNSFSKNYILEKYLDKNSLDGNNSKISTQLNPIKNNCDFESQDQITKQKETIPIKKNKMDAVLAHNSFFKTPNNSQIGPTPEFIQANETNTLDVNKIDSNCLTNSYNEKNIINSSDISVKEIFDSQNTSSMEENTEVGDIFSNNQRNKNASQSCSLLNNCLLNSNQLKSTSIIIPPQVLYQKSVCPLDFCQTDLQTSIKILPECNEDRNDSIIYNSNPPKSLKKGFASKIHTDLLLPPEVNIMDASNSTLSIHQNKPNNLNKNNLSKFTESSLLKPGINVLSLHTPKTLIFASLDEKGQIFSKDGKIFDSVIEWCSNFLDLTKKGKKLTNKICYSKIYYQGHTLSYFENVYQGLAKCTASQGNLGSSALSVRAPSLEVKQGLNEPLGKLPQNDGKQTCIENVLNLAEMKLLLIGNNEVGPMTVETDQWDDIDKWD